MKPACTCCGSKRWKKRRKRSFPRQGVGGGGGGTRREETTVSRRFSSYLELSAGRVAEGVKKLQPNVLEVSKKEDCVG